LGDPRTAGNNDKAPTVVRHDAGCRARRHHTRKEAYTVGFFQSSGEVDKYIGGVFRAAAVHPESGPKFAAADMVMRIQYTDPDAEISVVMHEPQLEVVFGKSTEPADVTMVMKADIGDKFWRGEYNLALGLIRGEVKAKGPVNKILKLVPLTKPLFPIYRDLVAEKDATVS
jgi:putative sterol carrier protein